MLLATAALRTPARPASSRTTKVARALPVKTLSGVLSLGDGSAARWITASTSASACRTVSRVPGVADHDTVGLEVTGVVQGQGGDGGAGAHEVRQHRPSHLARGAGDENAPKAFRHGVTSSAG